MDVLIVILLSFCVGHCYGRQNRQRKLAGLRLDVDSLRAEARELKLDIVDLQSWRNATFASHHDTNCIDSSDECVDSRSLGGFEQSIDAMEGRVSYIINGLAGEKMVNLEMMEDIRQIDAKLNQHMLSTDEHLNRLSNKFETSIGEALGQLKDLSARHDKATKANGDTREQVTHLLKQTSTTVQDTTATMRRLPKQYYARMKQDGWVEYDQSLYKLSTHKANFSNAVKSCEDNGASLVEIPDMTELQFLIDNFETRYLWLGASDRQTEGEWRWLSGQLMKGDNWYPGEPNNGGRSGVAGQDCLLMDRYLKPNFYMDFWCDSPANFVCKIQ